MLSRSSISDNASIRRYIEGGRGSFTLEGRDRHFTFRLLKGRYIYVLTKPPDGFTYLGLLTDAKTTTLTKASKVNEDSQVWRAFTWFAHRLYNDLPLDEMKFYHEGKCGLCGKPLTNPASIRAGFGPDCREKTT